MATTDLNMKTTCYTPESVLTPTGTEFGFLEMFIAAMVFTSVARLYISNRQLYKYKERRLDMYIAEFF